MANILDGKALSADLQSYIHMGVTSLKNHSNITPGLAVIMVGDDPASITYVRNKERACKEVGIRTKTVKLPAHVDQETLESLITCYNDDETIHGILVQLPLPDHLDTESALATIAPEKDVDGFSNENAGRLMKGLPCVTPCTPSGIMAMLDSTGVGLRGKHAVVVGRSNIVGKPIAMLLLREACTVTICHSKTVDLAAYTRQADVLIVAAGRPKLITADMVKPGAIVIDVGINRVDGKLVGDVDFDSVKEKASWISPVPGGVGCMTVTALLVNTLTLAEYACGIERL